MNRFDNFNVFFGIDFSQLEIRVLAHMSNDKRLIEIFNSGDDIHSLVGHDLTGRPIEVIKKDRDTRTKIKTIHFALVYGKKPVGIRAQIIAALASQGITSGITLEEITEIYDAYFKRYKGAKELIDNLIDYADKNNAAVNMFGFKREIVKKGDWRGTSWRNQAVNTPIQSGAHFLIVIAMALIHLYPNRYKYSFKKLIMEIHDALYSITKVRFLPKIYKEQKSLLEDTVPEFVEKWFKFRLRVPLEVEAKAGFRYGTLVEYKGEDTDTFIDMWRAKYKEVEEKVQKSIKVLKT